MSIMLCDGCGEQIDTDYKPFYYDVKIGYVTMNLCERCYILLGLEDDE